MISSSACLSSQLSRRPHVAGLGDSHPVPLPRVHESNGNRSKAAFFWQKKHSVDGSLLGFLGGFAVMLVCSVGVMNLGFCLRSFGLLRGSVGIASVDSKGVATEAVRLQADLRSTFEVLCC